MTASYGGPTDRLAAAVLTIEVSAILVAVDEVDAGLDRELEGELAVLALPDLQERPVVRRPDVVALGVDEQDVGLVAADLAAKDERRRAVGADPVQRLAVLLGDLTAQAPDVQRRLEEVAEPSPGSRSPRSRRGRGRCGRAPAAWSPGCRLTPGRTRGPAAGRNTCTLR